MPIITCRHFDKFLDDYIARRLGLLTRMQFHAHMVVCPPCRRYLDDYRRTVEAAHKLGEAPPPPAPMPPELAESIASFLARQDKDKTT